MLACTVEEVSIVPFCLLVLKAKPKASYFSDVICTVIFHSRRISVLIINAIICTDITAVNVAVA